ncbi:M56 family metallopeptidase [Marixanthomonas ophiurae]|uniref:Peptidase M56 domain-containing protein n=1 Tax=Marixanthomonas ophiurae TaxID=387659 RepID=A0A3E1QCY2_9FLAO|nr:M56 family metallopeptidase [Marixanthomonas ophiurae]RFN59954.1 hypothetical protein DZ858_07875 [Marixanthomonas ophiurae]
MDILIYIGKAAIVLSLFHVVYVVLLKSDTHFTTNRLFLISGLLLSFVVPIIQFTKTVTISTPKTNLAAYSEEIPAYLATTPQQIDWWYIAGVFYFIVAAVFFIRFLKQLFSLLLLLKKHPNTTKNGFKYIAINETILPFSFFNYIVYNPSLHSEEELAMILNHEKVHAHQWHSIDILVANLITQFQWVNPIAWFYKKSVKENLEYIADQETVAMVSSKKEYQIALVKASSASTIPALTTNFYQSFTKKRIVMLNKKNSKKVNALKLTTILPLLALFLWSFNVNKKVQYAEAKPSSVVNTNQKNEKDISKKQQISYTASKPDNKTSASVKSTNNSNVTPSLSSEKRNNTIQQDSVKGFQVHITKNTTVEELEAYKQRLKKEHNATFNYSNLNFNSKGEITSISIAYSDKRGNNNNYSVSSGQPINNFVLAVSENGAISSRTVLTEEQKMQRQKMMAQRDEMMAQRDEMISQRKSEMEKVKEQMKERQEEMETVQKERMEVMKKKMKEMKIDARLRMNVMKDSSYFKVNGNRFQINKDGNYVNEAGTVVKYKTDIKNKDPVYYVDGKETPKKALKLLSPDAIEKINVLKGKKALKKYGGKGVNGVVEITTKQ